jgi:hypothetical protein
MSGRESADTLDSDEVRTRFERWTRTPKGKSRIPDDQQNLAQQIGFVPALPEGSGPQVPEHGLDSEELTGPAAIVWRSPDSAGGEPREHPRRWSRGRFVLGSSHTVGFCIAAAELRWISKEHFCASPAATIADVVIDTLNRSRQTPRA